MQLAAACLGWVVPAGARASINVPPPVTLSPLALAAAGADAQDVGAIAEAREGHTQLFAALVAAQTAVVERSDELRELIAQSRASGGWPAQPPARAR